MAWAPQYSGDPSANSRGLWRDESLAATERRCWVVPRYRRYLCSIPPERAFDILVLHHGLKWSKGEDYVAGLPTDGIRLPGPLYPIGHRRIDRRVGVREEATAGHESLGPRLHGRKQLDPKCRRDLSTMVQIDRSYIGTIECPGSRKPVELITAHVHRAIAGSCTARLNCFPALFANVRCDRKLAAACCIPKRAEGKN